MRILFVSPYLPARDGIADYTSALAEALGPAGHEVMVAGTGSLEGAPAEVIASLGDVDTAIAEVAAWAPDVVHVQFAVAAFGAQIPRLLRLTRELRARSIPIVLTLHEVTRDIGALRGAGRLIYRKLVDGADLTIVHTGAARAGFEREVSTTAGVVVIPHHQRDLPAATASPAGLRERHGLGSGPVLLSFGFIHVDKGLQDLVAALHLLRSSGGPGSDAQLVVAGTVRPRPLPFKPFEARDRLHLRRVRRMIGRFGLADAVRFTGYVPAGEMRPWFDACDAAVLPYRRIEGSGVLSLAAAAGTPALVTDIGGLAAALPDGRWAFPPADPEALAATAREFLGSSPADRASARPRRDGSSIEAIAEATVASYERLAAAAPVPA